MKRIRLTFELKSVLTHFGEEKLSTTSLLRRQKFVVGDEILNIPVYSGNAIRGLCRRLIVRDFLQKLEIDELSLKVYHTLFSGGSRVSGINFTMEEKKRLCENIPFIAVMGAAVGDAILQGKVCFSPGYLVCQELNHFNVNQSDLSYKELIDETFYTRRDDKKSSIFDIKETDGTGSDNEPVQMKYDMETIAAGATIEANVLINTQNDIEVSCVAKMLELLETANALGSKGNIGHGAYALDYNKNELSTAAYDEYLTNNAEKIKAYVDELEKKLK